MPWEHALQIRYCDTSEPPRETSASLGTQTRTRAEQSGAGCRQHCWKLKYKGNCQINLCGGCLFGENTEGGRAAELTVSIAPNHPQINKQLFYQDGKAPFEVTDPRRSEVTDYSRSLQDGSETGGSQNPSKPKRKHTMTNGTIGPGLPHASAHAVLVVFARHWFRILIAIIT